MLSNPQQNLQIALAPCQHSQLIVDAKKVQGLCKHCDTKVSGPELVELLLATIDRRTEELSESRELCEKYERVILANSVNSL